ncbi:DUF930 domain-containing protein [Rhizobium sp. ICMP 5592]|uniref:DUF930 domain-containing protein n=1 Tax=Rhizobium sp. ICMP 5592 TaxID=2292445 RepID=UPI0012962C65|nr:DUF930 domain-containing protein [Rhizobium sp. ICMP 5592]MQB42492.1 DUF930 domain-containing protein [Rhizobium sp. ICMP 5592]
MEQAATKQDEKIGRGFVLSILLHVVLAAIFLLRPLMMPPQAAPEDNVNVELVPQPQEQQENATKPNEQAGGIPTPTPKPDEKAQQAEAQKQPEQKPDDPKAQLDQQDKAQADKPQPPASDPSSNPPTPKPEQPPPAEETPLPDMKGQEKDPSTTQQTDASAQANEAPATNDGQAEDQAASPAAKDSDAQTAQADAASQAKDPDLQPQQTQDTTTAPSEQAKAASPLTDPNSRDPASTPKPRELATDQPSDAQVAQPETPATEQDGTGKQEKAAATSNPETEQANAAEPDPQQPSSADNKVDQQITVPTVAGPQSQPPSKEQAASDNKSDPANGTSFVTEPDVKSQQQAAKGKSGGEKGQQTQAKKLYSGSEMAKMSKSDYDAWKKLPRRQRVRYLCRSEQKLQFGHDLNAVGFYNSAVSPAMLSDTGLFGNGEAVQTPKGWQQVKFTCQVDADALKVIAFSHAVVGRIPQSQAEKLGLPEY